jgi:transcriptional regulator with XRE-family HTH domain
MQFFKDIVKGRRKEKKLRQADVAEVLGVNPGTVGDYERGKSYPEMGKLEVLCQVLELDFLEIRSLVNTEKRGQTLPKDELYDPPFFSAPTADPFRSYIGDVFLLDRSVVDDVEEDEETIEAGLDQFPSLPILTILQTPDPKFEGNEYILAKLETRVGRHWENDIVILDEKVSRFHAILNKTDEGYVIEDKDSTNGTFVNQERVKQHLLKNGDEVQLGMEASDLDELATILKFE